MADASDDASDDDGLLPQELYPDFNVRCALFEGVTNATELVSQCVKGDMTGDLALIDADRVISEVLQQAATNCARRAEQGRGQRGGPSRPAAGRTTGADLACALAPPRRWAARPRRPSIPGRERACRLRGLFLPLKVSGVGESASTGGACLCRRGCAVGRRARGAVLLRARPTAGASSAPC